MTDINDYKNGEDKEWLKQHPGRQTGSVTNAIELPVKWLITLDGLRGEHDKLKFSMSKIKGMAETCILNDKWRKDNPMILEVHHDDDVYIFDGNHRARAAKLAKLNTYPCKINFYGGSESTFSVDKIIKKYASLGDSEMTNQQQHIEAMQKLINKAKIAIETGLNHKEVIAEMNQLASESGGNLGGDVDNFGSTTDQEYQNDRDTGEDIAGENDPNKGNQRRTGPREEPNDMVQEASSNKPCKDCGMPTDKCVCMKSQQPGNGKNPANTVPKIDPRQDPTKPRHAAFDLIVGLIKDSAQMTRRASHMEEIEIPFGDLKLENGVDYYMSGQGSQQHVSMLIDNYLKANVYPGNRRYTIARIEQTTNKLFVKVLLFDNQIEHEGAIDTKDGRLNKVSSVKSNKLQKTAWKMRLTEVIGENDDTGLVKCPIEGGFLTRSCGTCPFAGNPKTYIVDKGVECHFDEGAVWLNNLGVKEHRLLDNSSND